MPSTNPWLLLRYSIICHSGPVLFPAQKACKKLWFSTQLSRCSGETYWHESFYSVTMKPTKLTSSVMNFFQPKISCLFFVMSLMIWDLDKAVYFGRTNCKICTETFNRINCWSRPLVGDFLALLFASGSPSGVRRNCFLRNCGILQREVQREHLTSSLKGQQPYE